MWEHLYELFTGKCYKHKMSFEYGSFGYECHFKFCPKCVKGE